MKTALDSEIHRPNRPQELSRGRKTLLNGGSSYGRYLSWRSITYHPRAVLRIVIARENCLQINTLQRQSKVLTQLQSWRLPAAFLLALRVLHAGSIVMTNVVGMTAGIHTRHPDSPTAKSGHSPSGVPRSLG
jgi:hypothetical protein